MFEKIKQSIQNAAEIVPQKQHFLCEHFVPLCENGLTMISASGGKGKSFLSMQIALQFTLKEKQKCLLWLSEDSKSTSKQRAENILKHIIKTNAKLLNFIDICDEMPPAINKASLNNFIELFKPYKLIVIDPLIAFYEGDENNNSQARVFMNCLNKIAKENKQSILITHHSTKINNNETSKSRGASAFIDAVRLAYELEFPKKNEDQDKSTNPNMRLLKLTKDNLGLKSNIEWKNSEKIISIIPTKDSKITKAKDKNNDKSEKFIINVIENSENKEDEEKWERAKKEAGNGINLI